MPFVYHNLKFMLLSAILIACSPAAERIERNERTSSRVQAAAVSNNGQYSLVSTTQEGLRLFDTQTNQLLHNWQQEDEGINQIISTKFSPLADVALAASRMTLVLWDTQTGDVLGAWRNDESFILDVAVSNQGQDIVLARNDGVVLLFEPRTGRRVEFNVHTDKVNKVSISANGRFVLSGGNDHQAILWQTNPIQVRHVFTLPGRITQLTLDTLGRYALVASATKAEIRHLVSGEVHQSLNLGVRQKVFTSATFSPQSELLLTGTASRLVEVWSVASGQRLCGWHIKGRAGEHPPRAAIIGVSFIDAATIIVETSAGFSEQWRLPAHCQADADRVNEGQ